MNDRYLMHYGVKGMKWGVRHDPQSTGRRLKNKTFKLTDKQKKIAKRVAIGSAIVASGIAIYGGYKYYDIKVPKTIVVQKSVRKQVGKQHIGQWQGFPQYVPVYRDVLVSEIVPNPNRKYFK